MPDNMIKKSAQGSMNDEQQPEKAIIAGVYETSGGDTYEFFLHSMDELAELAKACYKDPAARVTQTLEHRTTALYMGAGKVGEIKDAIWEQQATVVLFNDTLSPIQLRNLQKELEVEVLDRTALILEIFRSRARTREAKLQVELARLSYLKPRLIGMWEKQNRQGGTSGAMSSKGEGETQLEIDRRTIDHRLAVMRSELKIVERERQTQRKKRQASGLPLVALVGYTNAGKSTIMNAFVREFSGDEKQVFEADMLFATLDTTVRRIGTGNREDFLLSDTVGFIQKLPTGLVEAFKSTLEEVKEADLILQVVDYSDSHYDDQMTTTVETIAELGAGAVPMLIVFNKCDKRPDISYPRRAGTSRNLTERNIPCVYISAREEASLTLLKDTILEQLFGSCIEETITIPYSEGGRLAEVLSHSQVLQTEYLEEGTRLTVRRRQVHTRSNKSSD